MGYLTHKEKSILFSALTKEEKLCKGNGLEELVPVVKSLEGKFYYDRFEKEIRNKAIDEVIRQLDAEVESSAKFIREYDDSIAQKAYYRGLKTALKIAEQLKGGAE